MKALFFVTLFLLSSGVPAGLIEIWEFPTVRVTEKEYKDVKVVSETDSEDPAQNTYGVSKQDRSVASDEEVPKMMPAPVPESE